MEYQYDCKCYRCRKITKYFGIKAEEEAKRLGYQVTLRGKGNE